MSDSNQFRLLVQRRFIPFFTTQFLGALNDNVFRNGLIILVTFQGIKVAGLDEGAFANVAVALFMLPYFLFSALAGQIADKYDKAFLFRRIKLFELGLMVVATVAFLTQSYVIVLFILFMMGVQSTLFGPVKYSYLPHHLDTSELIAGNALVGAGTYTAIILGLLIGGLAVAYAPGDQRVLVLALLSIALIGYLAARQIPKTPASDPDLKINFNLWAETRRIVGFARRDRTVFMCVLGISWFWFYGAIVLTHVPVYTKDILLGTEAIATALLVTFAVGVGIGSLLCERLSGHRIELGLVPFGSIGLTLFAADLYIAQPTPLPGASSTFAELLAQPGSLRILFDLTMIGVFGGLYSVPLYALMQKRAERKQLSRIIAANNILNSIFMVTSTGVAIALLAAGLSIPELFLTLSVLNAMVAIYIYGLLPEFLMRFLAWIIISVFYRVRLEGADRVPDKGPAIVVCNHVSYMDPILLAGCLKRPMRFVMWYRIFDIPVLNWFFRQTRAIPIASARENETVMNAAFEAIEEELAAGNVVCIFPEGGLTMDGEVQRFRPGIERVLENQPVPVVPVALRRLWGSWFSRRRDGGLRRLPGRLFARVPVSVGAPLPPSKASAAQLELQVRALRGDER
ncbi:MAG: MFS transporter [Pseudomonadota bacterium]